MVLDRGDRGLLPFEHTVSVVKNLISVSACNSKLKGKCKYKQCTIFIGTPNFPANCLIKAENFLHCYPVGPLFLFTHRQFGAPIYWRVISKMYLFGQQNYSCTERSFWWNEGPCANGDADRIRKIGWVFSNSQHSHHTRTYTNVLPSGCSTKKYVQLLHLTFFYFSWRPDVVLLSSTLFFSPKRIRYR